LGTTPPREKRRIDCLCFAAKEKRRGSAYTREGRKQLALSGGKRERGGKEDSLNEGTITVREAASTSPKGRKKDTSFSTSVGEGGRDCLRAKNYRKTPGGKKISDKIVNSSRKDLNLDQGSCWKGGFGRK